MLTTAQVRHLQELHDTLTTRHDVGPVEPPMVGARHLCGTGTPRWLYDTTTAELAIRMAKQADHHCACRFQILGIQFGHPKLEPLRDHYGLSEQQIQRMNEIDLQPIPDAQHSGRTVWIERQQKHIMLAIRAGTPAPPAGSTTKDPLLVLTTIEPDRQQKIFETQQPVAANMS